MLSANDLLQGLNRRLDQHIKVGIEEVRLLLVQVELDARDVESEVGEIEKTKSSTHNVHEPFHSRLTLR